MAAILVIGACGFVIDSAARWVFRGRRRGPSFSGKAPAHSGLKRPDGLGAARHPES